MTARRWIHNLKLFAPAEPSPVEDWSPAHTPAKHKKYIKAIAGKKGTS